VPARAAVAPPSYKPAKREISFQTPGASAAHGNEFLAFFLFFLIKTKGGWQHPTHMEYQNISSYEEGKKKR
jgi:hypothetical protein